ncbi:CAP domain-containing protein [Metabacillus malikii]|uniref:YkwD family protein n=1 Tax=Metabacillus malikii TaxID=1504265 RepID=A0ABT9ZKZ5_9BACI|nr:CAP domain-containing protein [Metabacillus malikii]MDQ0231890.1 putative YkwD family protein [Metabacillus malikii]
MILKKTSMFITGALVAGLVACNNNEAMDDTNRNQIGPVNVANENQQTGDQSYGPYSRNAHNRNNGIPNETETAHRDPENDRSDDNDFDLVPDFRENDNMDISSSKTNISSKNYPHTKAIVVREAKYSFERVNTNNSKQQVNQTNTQQQPAKQQVDNNRPKVSQTPTNNNQTPANNNQTAAKNNQTNTTTNTQGLSQEVQQVIDLTNAERRRNGLPDLKADVQLSGVAQKKSEDMRQNHYFSHTSPTYGSPFDMMRDFGVTYKTAGENIAQGQQTASKVVQSWMNSEGHRKNIMSKDFTHIGVGYDASGHHWTQMFIGK